jgi:2-haloacid dehalogenase
MAAIRALIFDVFGTLVDWRSGITRDVRVLLGSRVADAATFADAWRAQYQPAMEKVRSGALPFSKLDILHRHNLDHVLADLNLDDVDEPTRAELNLAWHRLDAWPDVKPGLLRLRERFRIAPCSNGNVSLMVNLARRNGFPWDAILGAEFARDYKPKAIVYQSAAAAFDLRPEETLMVAAHSSDLASAAAAGLCTAFIARPDEKGPGRGETKATVPVEFSAGSLSGLADLLGA